MNAFEAILHGTIIAMSSFVKGALLALGAVKLIEMITEIAHHD